MPCMNPGTLLLPVLLGTPVRGRVCAAEVVSAASDSNRSCRFRRAAASTMNDITVRNVSFHSDGDRIAGYLHVPGDWKEGDPGRPGIVVLAGYSGNTQADCTHMMKRLCAEGWFVLGFDYRGFGESEGQRNRHRPLEQAQNTFDALTYMQTVPGIDGGRLGIYGTSFGGANGVWVAAHDERVVW